MINYADKAKNPSFATAKQVRDLYVFSVLASRGAWARVVVMSSPVGLFQVLNILQTHYPERLSASLILNVPFLLHAFYKMISPLIDPVTRNKMKFNPKPIEDGLFAADELFSDGGWGGSRDFVWDHEKYWGPFVRMCDEIRAAQMARWRELGARVGCDEWDYKTSSSDAVTVVAKPEGAVVPEEAGDVAEQTPVGRAHQTQGSDQGQAPAQLSATNHILANGDSEVQSAQEGEAKSEDEANAI
jgi:hypothetical protein